MLVSATGVSSVVVSAECHAMPDAAIASAINERSVHVLVNLNGWIQGHRNVVCALVPAPVQLVSLVAYP